MTDKDFADSVLDDSRELLELIQLYSAGHGDGDSHLLLADHLALIYDSGKRLHDRLDSHGGTAPSCRLSLALRKLHERVDRIFGPANFRDDAQKPVNPRSENCHFHWPDYRSWESLLRPAIAQLANVRGRSRHVSNGIKAGYQASLKAGERQAYASYEFAAKRLRDVLEREPTDREAYDYLRDEGVHDYQLPQFLTWQRYLRAGRRFHGTNKHDSRVGRAGRSIVHQSDI